MVDLGDTPKEKQRRKAEAVRVVRAVSTGMLQPLSLGGVVYSEIRDGAGVLILWPATVGEYRKKTELEVQSAERGYQKAIAALELARLRREQAQTLSEEQYLESRIRPYRLLLNEVEVV